MRKILAALLALTLVSQVYLHSKSDDYEPLIVFIVLESTKPASSTNRAPAVCPVEGCYNTITNMVELSFSSDLGKVYATLENLMTGEITDHSGDSAIGAMMFPASQNSIYNLNIVTESGRSFKSSFVTGNMEYTAN